MAQMNVSLAHDMRMPLQLIYSCAQMIQLELDDPDQPAGKYAALLMENVNALQRMLARALDDACIPSAGATGDLVARTMDICARVELTARARGLHFRYAGNVESLKMALDAEKYARILLNLISNALKFTPAGGSVCVRLRAMGDFAEVSVSDTGVGIPPERQQCIFERGVTEGGHGLGLCIAREYAQQMGGTLRVESVPGAGSTFTLRLPVRAAADARQTLSASCG